MYHANRLVQWDLELLQNLLLALLDIAVVYDSPSYTGLFEAFVKLIHN